MKKPTPAVDVKLLVRAGNALIAWRCNWERICAEPPSTNNGQDKFDLRLWKYAGELMDAAGEKRSMP